MNLSEYESINAAEWNDDSGDDAEAKKPQLRETCSQQPSILTSRENSAPTYDQLNGSHSETVNTTGGDKKPSVGIQNGPQTVSYQTTVCRYWADGDRCRYNRDTCRYLHEHKPDGVVRSSPRRWYTNWKLDQPPIETLKNRLPGESIDRITLSDLPDTGVLPRIESCEYLASYNWLEHSEVPTILVPGSPRMWSPFLSNKRLEQDSGEYFRDLNAAKYSSYPTEPTFRALLSMQPDFDPSVIDIVGCGSTLGNLLRFCEGTSVDFRFEVDRIKETVFFIRKESSPTTVIQDIHGYGHTFPELHTKWDPDMVGSLSHQRIIKYEFGGFKFLVRTACDGYVKEAISSETLLTTVAKDDSTPEINDDLAKAQSETPGDLHALFKTLKFTDDRLPPKESLQVKIKGCRIPQHAIFDLKTRAKRTRRPIDMNEIYRRLWVNQTPYFIYAEHLSGYFNLSDVQPLCISDDVSKWEKDHGLLLKRYLAIVTKLIAASKKSAHGKLQVIRWGSGPLEIRERAIGADNEVLPSDLRSKWSP